MKNKILSELKKQGVNFIDENTVYIDTEVKIESGVTIYPNNVILGNTIIKKGTILKENNHIENSVIGENNVISFSYIENSKLGNKNFVGPFARIREHSEILNNTKIGNFVEIKKSVIHDGVKASHLAYVGDAEVFDNTNISCGVIFCNYNGKQKFKTIVHKNCFLGSNSNLIAPVEIGENTFIAAGTTVSKDIESDKFVLGNRDLKIKDDTKKLHIKRGENE